MNFRKIKNLEREKINYISRRNYVRLDKNEKVDNFNQSYLKKFVLDSFDIAAYPETGKIYKILSKNLKISEKQLVITPGSDFGLRICFEYFCNNKNKKIICLEPTFGMVGVYAKLYKIKQIKIGYDKKLNLNFNKLIYNINHNISLITLANPNSPTGSIIEKRQMVEVIKKANKFKVPVLIDEAYYGFYDYSYFKLLNKFDNLIILRTFSKSFGIAGLRAGYLISNLKIIKELYKFKPMYEINSAACKILEFLFKNKNIERNHVKSVLKGQSYFQEELLKLKLIYLKTFANFIHVKFGNKKKLIEKKLKLKKILTRKGPGVKGFEDYLRFTLGPKSEMKKVINILKKNI